MLLSPERMNWKLRASAGALPRPTTAAGTENKRSSLRSARLPHLPTRGDLKARRKVRRMPVCPWRPLERKRAAHRPIYRPQLSHYRADCRLWHHLQCRFICALPVPLFWLGLFCVEGNIRG